MVHCARETNDVHVLTFDHFSFRIVTSTERSPKLFTSRHMLSSLCMLLTSFVLPCPRLHCAAPDWNGLTRHRSYTNRLAAELEPLELTSSCNDESNAERDIAAVQLSSWQLCASAVITPIASHQPPWPTFLQYLPELVALATT